MGEVTFNLPKMEEGSEGDTLKPETKTRKKSVRFPTMSPMQLTTNVIKDKFQRRRSTLKSHDQHDQGLVKLPKIFKDKQNFSVPDYMDRPAADEAGEAADTLSPFERSTSPKPLSLWQKLGRGGGGGKKTSMTRRLSKSGESKEDEEDGLSVLMSPQSQQAKVRKQLNPLSIIINLTFL